MKVSPTELRRSFSESGERISKNLTVFRSTWQRISGLVPTGHGQYGSTFLDRAAQLFLFILRPVNQQVEEDQIYNMFRRILADNDLATLNAAASRAHWIYQCLRRMSEAQYWLTSEDIPWDEPEVGEP